MKKKKMWPLKLSCCLLLCGLILGSGKMRGWEMKWYVATHSQIALGAVLDFEWDVAYVDRGIHGRGETIKNKYGLECELPYLGGDYLNRLLFFREGRLVKTIEYFRYDLTFSIDVDRFYPTTVFEIGNASDLTPASRLDFEGNLLRLRAAGAAI